MMCDPFKGPNMSSKFAEIGSEFWIEKVPEKLLTERDGVYVISGRTAIDLSLQEILKKRQVMNVLMPAWCCNSMLAPFLDRNIEVGQVLVVDGAIRDEGFSYHYIPASRVIHTDPAVTERIVSYLEEREVSYLRGLGWTTDAIFRETADRIALRKEEGAKIVEMEQAGCIAVAQFRKFAYGALIYGGDDLTGEDWDGRSWRSREGVRYDLVQLCADLVGRI